MPLDAIITNHKASFREVVLVTVPPAFSLPLACRVLNPATMADARLELNEAIRGLAAKRDVRLLDAHDILQAKAKAECLSADGIHLNAVAYGHLEKALGNLKP